MESTRRAGLAALAALIALASSLPSRGARAADDKAVRDAQARFNEGLARVKSGDFEAARISFEQAYVVIHKPDILWNLALAEEKSGHPLDALHHFKELTSTAAADTDRASAQKHVAGLMAQMGHIDVQAPAGTMVTVDGVQSAGVAPLPEPVDVTPGRHVVEGKLTDGTRSVTVDTAPGETARVTIEDTRPATPTATSPLTPTGPSTSTPTSASASTPAGSPPDADSPSVPTAKLVTTVSLGAAAILSIGAGAFFGLQSQSDANTAAGYRNQYPKDHCVDPAAEGCSSWNDAVVSQNRDATISNVFYVAGGVLAAGSLATWLLWPKPRASAAAWVVPAVGPSGASVGLGGRF
jgi:hypothetical protein